MARTAGRTRGRRTGGRGRGGRRLLLALGTLVLAGVGFVAGLVAGVVVEEPALVVGHVVGRSTDVPWAPGDEAAPGGAETLPAVAAPPTPAASGGGFLVQVGAFASSDPAESLADALRDKGYRVRVSPGAGSRDGRWRVRVGPVPSREEADRLAGRLKREEKLPTWVLGGDDT